MSGLAITNISKVKKENIIPTLNLLQQKVFDMFYVTRNMWCILGSTGKKDYSGDIDIAIDYNKLLLKTGMTSSEFGELVEQRCIELNWQVNNRLNSGFKMIHIGIPIVNQPNQIAQVDIMYSTNLEFTKFKYFAPRPEESKYKGAQRSMLLDCMLKYCTLHCPTDSNIEDTKQVITKDGKVYPYVRFSHLSLNTDGLIKTTKTFRGVRKILNIPKIESIRFITSDPQQIIDFVFGNDLYTKSDFNSFESIWNNVLFNSNFKYKDKIQDVIIAFIRRNNDNNKWQLEQNKLPLPIEVIRYCNEHNINIEELINE